MKRFPLFDNFYDPSRQSADGHQWITEAMAPYADDIQSPDWVRSYPGGNAGDALAYHEQGLPVLGSGGRRSAGEDLRRIRRVRYVPTAERVDQRAELERVLRRLARTSRLGWRRRSTIRTRSRHTSSVPAVSNHLIKNFPQFDLDIPDQFRVDLWVQDFNKDLAAGTVPALSILWIMDDHTGGPPTPDAQQADNDLAVGRIIDYISHSNVWSSSAIFIEEDDAQNGVDHVDGHRSPGYIVSPYAVQNGPTDHTYYTQVNMTRTIEQILGLPPMNQFDLVASPMRTAFVKGDAARGQLQAVDARAEPGPAGRGRYSERSVQQPDSPAVKALRAAWLKKKAEIFAGKLTRPDSEDPDTVNHLNWYLSTGFTRPYPGEKTVRPPSDFNNPAPDRRRRGRLKHVPTATASPRLTGERFFQATTPLRLPMGDRLPGIWRADAGVAISVTGTRKLATILSRCPAPLACI